MTDWDDGDWLQPAPGDVNEFTHPVYDYACHACFVSHGGFRPFRGSFQ